MAKPSSKIDWTLGNASPGVVRIEPSPSKKTEGWNIDERPAREWMNWLLYNIYEWIVYFETKTDTTVALNTVYQAFVGVGGIATHSDLNAVMADGAIAAGSRILVISPLTLNSIQQITKNNLQIEFLPTAILSKGSATKGIQISATQCQLVRPNIQGFSGGSDEAIRIDASSDNASIQFARFKNNTTDVNDLSSTSQEFGSMVLA